MAIHGNRQHFVHLLLDVAGNTLAFIADDEGQLASCIPLMGRRPLHIRVPKIQKPASLSLSRVWLRLVTRAMGICSMAPVEVLATTGVTPTARCLGMMTPATLVASAVLKIELQIVRVSQPVQNQ